MSAVKLLMSWDILPGREEDYFEFHIRKFIPLLKELDLSLNEAWLKVYGEGPRLMAEAVIPDLKRANQVLDSDGWKDLSLELEDFVENFDYKVIPALTRWQI